jgi:DNA polymerase II small subunit
MNLQVNPEVVRHILEQDVPELIERIIAAVPEDCIVVSARHIPGVRPVRDGMRFHVDPEAEVVSGPAA